MRIRAVSFTQNGDVINKILSDFFKNDDYLGYGNRGDFLEGYENIYKWCEENFYSCDALIFIGAIGIAVRAVSSFIISKDKDPAVIVIDDNRRFVIPVLSGHMGGANELAENISSFLGSISVITTATDINRVWAVDLWAVKNGYKIGDISKIKNISSALLRGEKVGLFSDYEIEGEIPENVIIGREYENGIVISVFKKDLFKNTLNIIPPVIEVGVGSRKNSSKESLKELFYNITERENIYLQAVDKIATIDIKSEEKSIQSLCRELKKEPVFYTAEELSNAAGSFRGSSFVKSVTGVDNICERAAALACGGEYKILVEKTKGDGVTLALCEKDWRVCFEDNNVGN